MKAFFGHALLIVCLTPAISFTALAESQRNTATGGVIHFHGQIVEGGCQVDPSVRNVSVSCYRRGTNHQDKISVLALARGETQHFEDASLNLKWVNQQKTLAVISVQYQ